MTTGYVYDPVFLKHDMPGHPENRHRLEAIMQRLAESGVLERLSPVPARPATRAELEAVHRPSYVDRVQALADGGGGYLDPDTYVRAGSFEAAGMAAGGAIEAVLAVLDGRVANAFALVRPPGHHAMAGHGMGFCLFGNVAVASSAARQAHPSSPVAGASPVGGAGGVERILIVDFDVHHGNGTQAMVADDPSICFVSTHQYPFYPGSGAVDEIGRGPARGTLVNMPLSPGAGDGTFRALYEQVLAPLARRFRPNLVLVSAGYDAHWDDPLAGLALSLSGYASLTRTLVELADELCGGRIVFVLEGGYHQEVLASGVLNTFYALLGDTTVVDPLGSSPRPEPDASACVALLRKMHGLS